MAVLLVDAFTNLLVSYTDFARNEVTPADYGVWTPVAGTLQGVGTWGPGVIEQGIRGQVSALPDLSALPDDAVIDSIRVIISANGDSTFTPTSATTTLGSGANGTINLSLTPGTPGKNGYKISVILAPGANAPMEALKISNQTFRVTLGTDGTGAADATKNTAALIAARLNGLTADNFGNELTAVASGTGADTIPVTAQKFFLGGTGESQSEDNFSNPGTIVSLPITGIFSPSFTSRGPIVAANERWKPWLAWSFTDRDTTENQTLRKIDTLNTAVDITSKVALAASRIGFEFIIVGVTIPAIDDGTLTVSRFTLEITYHSSSQNLVVNAGQSQIVRGPAPATAHLAATVSGDTDGVITYLWEYWEGPGDATVVSEDTAETDVIIDFYEPGDYVFQVTATCTHSNGTAFTSTSQVTLTIRETVAPRVNSFSSFVIGRYDA